MKKTLTVSLLFVSMLLAACNTTETSSSNEPTNDANTAEQTVDTNNSTNEEVIEEENQESSTDDKVEKAPSETSNASNDSNTEVVSNKTIDFTFNSETFHAKTNAATSEELGYKIQLAEGFTLTSEEPGSDVVFYTADSNYSMRVEYYSAEDNSYDSLLSTVENSMIASTNNNFEKLTIEQSAFGIHKGTQFISVDEASGLQTIGAIFEKEGKIVIVTIFDGPDNSLKDAFLQMAYSIE